MRWEFTPAAERALALAASRIPPHADHLTDGGLVLLAALLRDPEGSAYQWLSKLGFQPSTAGPLPDLEEPSQDQDGLEEKPNEVPLGRELVRHLPLALSGILRSARQVSHETWGDSTISSESLLVGVFRRSMEGRIWLETSGLSESRFNEAIQGTLGAPIPMEESIQWDWDNTPPGWIRLADAVGNRLREGLRVLEDHYRFFRELPWLVRHLKSMRHRVDQLLSSIPGVSQALEQRNVLGDEGAGMRTGSERPRQDSQDLERANWKRIQEAFRSLEEHSKVAQPEAAASWEALRYESYTLEKRASEVPHQRLQDAVLMWLVGPDCLLGLETTIKEALQGGVDLIQLRFKDRSDREILDWGKKIREWTSESGALFLVNDRPDLATLLGADGVHLGVDDLPMEKARRICPKGTLIGVSTHETRDWKKAELEGADYLGVGPVFPSQTKSFGSFAGLDYVQEVAQKVTKPWFAIGGINLENIGEVVTAGARRIAVSHAISQSQNPQAMAKSLRLALGAKLR